MENCKELYTEGTPEYDACVEKNKSEENKLVETDQQTGEQFEKEKAEKDRLAMLEIINRNRANAGLEPQDNSNTVYNPEDDVNQLVETTITKDATDVSAEELKKKS